MRIRDSIAALLYIVVIIVGTLAYANSGNLDVLKHPVNALTTMWNEAGESDTDSE